MPCYSKIQTVLIDLKTIEAAAAKLGITISKRTANRFTLKKDGEHIDIERASEGEKFSTMTYSGSGNWPDEIITPLTLEYARARVKDFAQKKGYTLSAGTKAGELVLTSYR